MKARTTYKIGDDIRREKPFCRYAGSVLYYLFTFSENDHGNRALDYAQMELNWIRNHGHQACCLHRDTEHDVYAPLKYRERVNLI